MLDVTSRLINPVSKAFRGMLLLNALLTVTYTVTATGNRMAQPTANLRLAHECTRVYSA